jgi:hypothetical protein
LTHRDTVTYPKTTRTNSQSCTRTEFQVLVNGAPGDEGDPLGAYRLGLGKEPERPPHSP